MINRGKKNVYYFMKEKDGKSFHVLVEAIWDFWENHFPL